MAIIRPSYQLRVAIIGCGPPNQEPMTYLGAKWTIRGLVSRKIQDLGRENDFLIQPQLYWPAGRKNDYPLSGTYDAVIIPGSKLHIDKKGMKRHGWMNGLVDFIREVDYGVPVLGICFGHQAIAAAHGAEIERIPPPKHIEVGFSPVHMTEHAREDALFKGLPDTFEGLFSHFTYVASKPDNGTVLATGEMPDMIQAYRVGESTWGVQFHPDYEGHNIDELVEGRKQRLARMLDISQINTINKRRRDTQILHNFIEHSVRRLD